MKTQDYNKHGGPTSAVTVDEAWHTASIPHCISGQNFTETEKNNARRNFPDLNRPCDANWLLFKFASEGRQQFNTFAPNELVAQRLYLLGSIELKSYFFSHIWVENLTNVLKNMNLSTMKHTETAKTDNTTIFF